MNEKLAPSNRHLEGPFDSSEVELPATYLDFGALKFVPQPDVAIRLEVEEATNRVVALTLEKNGSVLQVSVFAASKDEGVWAEVLEQLRAAIVESGGSAQEFHGQLGLGLETNVKQPDGSLKAVRFVGVDGPRWFLRGSITGSAITDALSAGEIEELFRNLVVHRGVIAMPPKEPLEITVPQGIISGRPGL